MSLFDFFRKPKQVIEAQAPEITQRDFGSSDAYADNSSWTPILGPYGRSHTGIEVNPINSMQCGAVYSCVKILTGDIAKLPLRLLELNDDIWKEVKPGNPKTDYLLRLMHRPNKRMTPTDFKTHIAMSLILVGNAYNAIIRDDSGKPTDIIPCIPSTVSIVENAHGDLFYNITNRLFPIILSRFTEEDMCHVRAMSLDGGIHGASIVQLVSEQLGIGMATQELVASMFHHGTNMNGYLSTDQVGLPKEILENLRDNWNSAQSGMHNAGKTPALQAGFKYNVVGVNADQWQLVESRKQIVEEIARLFGVPLYKLSNNDRSSYNAIDAQQQDYIDGTLIPLTNPIEEALNKVLLFDDQIGKLKFAFDFRALEKGDIKTRSEFVHTMLTDGVLSVNEVRKEFNLESIGPEGDVRTKPLNTGVLGSVQAMPIFQIEAPKKETETISETPEQSTEKPSAD